MRPFGGRLELSGFKGGICSRVYGKGLETAPLTTARQPFVQWGMVATRKLLDIVKNKSKSFLTEKIVGKIAVELIVRESTAPAFHVENISERR